MRSQHCVVETLGCELPPLSEEYTGIRYAPVMNRQRFSRQSGVNALESTKPLYNLLLHYRTYRLMIGHMADRDETLLKSTNTFEC